MFRLLSLDYFSSDLWKVFIIFFFVVTGGNFNYSCFEYRISIISSGFESLAYKLFSLSTNL